MHGETLKNVGENFVNTICRILKRVLLAIYTFLDVSCS